MKPTYRLSFDFKLAIRVYPKIHAAQVYNHWLMSTVLTADPSTADIQIVNNLRHSVYNEGTTTTKKKSSHFFSQKNLLFPLRVGCFSFFFLTFFFVLEFSCFHYRINWHIQALS